MGYKGFLGLLVGTLMWALCLPGSVAAQSGTIESGTTIVVRTNERINARTSDGRVYTGSVDQDVPNTRGGVAIPRGAYVEMIVRTISPNQLSLDLDSVVVNGERYGIETDETVVGRDGLGANDRTAKYVGGGAVIGAIIGAITGGGKGAAIGGAIGAAGGAGTQVLTKGNNVNVPAESLVTFRLEQPLRTGSRDSGYYRSNQHYHPGYEGSNYYGNAAYQDGLTAGRDARDRHLRSNARSDRWVRGQQLRDFQTGYNVGYNETRSVPPTQVNGFVQIGTNKMISWRGPANGQVYVQVDSNPRQLFAAGPSGSEAAPWITPGHVYVFILQDTNGKEVARAQSDLRQSRGR